jgi:hypothetical protein
LSHRFAAPDDKSRRETSFWRHKLDHLGITFEGMFLTKEFHHQRDRLPHQEAGNGKCKGEFNALFEYLPGGCRVVFPAQEVEAARNPTTFRELMIE